MEPGDLLLYESVRNAHGRWPGLKGKYYDNIFIHYKPVWYDYAESKIRKPLTQLSLEEASKIEKEYFENEEKIREAKELENSIWYGCDDEEPECVSMGKHFHG